MILEKISNQNSDQRHWSALSLFAGAGGCSLGIKNAGISILKAYELADAAVATYTANFGIGSCEQTDLASCDFNSIQRSLGVKRGELDLIIGGPPCQGFTTAGNRNANDPRNRLVRNYVQALNTFLPRWFMMENVEGILTTANGDFLIECIKRASELGYSLFLKKVYMQEYGIPQRRKRVILVGNREGKPFDFPQPQKIATGELYRDGVASLRDAIEDLEEKNAPEIDHSVRYESGIKLERIRSLSPGQTMRDLPLRLQHKSFLRRSKRRVCDGMPSAKRGGAPSGIKRLLYDEPCLTITSAANSEFVHPAKDRLLTIRECARIQTFPDSFVFCGTEAQKMVQIGNAIPPKFATQIAQAIIRADQSPARECQRGLVSFEVTKAVAQSPALARTCSRLKWLLADQIKQLELEI